MSSVAISQTAHSGLQRISKYFQFISAERQVRQFKVDYPTNIYFAAAAVEDVAELTEADAEAAADVAACAAATAASMTPFASMELRAASMSLSCLLNIGWMIFL